MMKSEIKVRCSFCGYENKVVYLQPGDMINCKGCNNSQIVPGENRLEVEENPQFKFFENEKIPINKIQANKSNGYDPELVLGKPFVFWSKCVYRCISIGLFLVYSIIRLTFVDSSSLIKDLLAYIHFEYIFSIVFTLIFISMGICSTCFYQWFFKPSEVKEKVNLGDVLFEGMKEFKLFPILAAGFEVLIWVTVGIDYIL